MAYWNPNPLRTMMGSRSLREQPGYRGTRVTRRTDATRPIDNPAFPRQMGEDRLPSAATVPAIVPSTNLGVAPTGTTFSPNAIGGVTQAASTTGAGGDISTPWSGFGQNFAPAAAPMIFDNPQIALMQAMQNAGYDPTQNQALYQMALPQTDYANALAMLALGGGNDLGAGANNAAVNWMGNYLQQGITPGGAGIDFSKGLAALQGGATDPRSVIGEFLNVDDPAQQISNYKSLALPLAASSLHPLFARAFQNAINQAGDQYLYNMAGPNMGVGNQGFGGYLGAQSPFM